VSHCGLLAIYIKKYLKKAKERIMETQCKNPCKKKIPNLHKKKILEMKPKSFKIL
jgi:hypothetical protein